MGFLPTVVAAVALYAVGVALAPEREGIRKACLTAFSLLLILSLLPKGGLGDLSLALPLPDEETVGEETYAAQLKKTTEESVARELRERFSIAEGSLSVSSDFSYRAGEVSLSYIAVTLGKSGFLADIPTLVRYVEENYKVRCEVKTDGS